MPTQVELFKRYQVSPIFFIEQMWGLTPQPVLPQHADEVKSLVARGKFDEVKVSWFAPFVKGEHITWQQWLGLLAIERALRDEAPNRISIVSGHGVGKDAMLSWVIIWFLFCFKDAQVPCTAPTSAQLHDILWKELSVWLSRLKSSLVREKFEWTTGYLRILESPETWFARARTASVDQPEALAGVHGEHVLMIGDEASGIPEVVFKTAEGALTNAHVLVFMVSNGTRSTGYFFDTHHNDASNWQHLSFDGRESPIVDKAYVERIANKHGEDSDEFAIRVSGGFPREGAVDDKGYMVLIRETDLRFTNNGEFSGRKRLGIDPAGEGDNKTTWVLRDRFKARVVLRENISNELTIVQKTLMLMDKYDLSPEDIYVDIFGVGAKVVVEFTKTTYNGQVGLQVNSVHLGDEASDKEAFTNVRAEAHWRMREWLIAGAELFMDEELKEQLKSLLYRRELNSKVGIMSKREMKKLGLKSPDSSDGLVVTFATTDDFDEDYAEVPADTPPLFSEIGI